MWCLFLCGLAALLSLSICVLALHVYSAGSENTRTVYRATKYSADSFAVCVTYVCRAVSCAFVPATGFPHASAVARVQRGRRASLALHYSGCRDTYWRARSLCMTAEAPQQSEYDPALIRNFCIIAHIGAHKTRMLRVCCDKFVASVGRRPRQVYVSGSSVGGDQHGEQAANERAALGLTGSREGARHHH
jgi:hypothetical protein